MAGTAAGIAKARAAREAKQRQRQAIDEATQQHEQNCSPVLVDAVVPPVASVATVEVTKSQQGRALADLMIDQLQPAAVRELGQAMRQTKSPMLRFSAACKLLDLARLEDPADAGDEGSMLERLATAVGLRARTLNATDAAPIREEAVTLEAAGHSQQQPDSASDKPK